MNKKVALIVLTIVIGNLLVPNLVVFAQSNENGNESEQVKLEIMPKSDADLGIINQKIIKESDDHVRDTYNDIAKDTNVSDQIASGVMTRDTILNYGIYLLRFLSQAGIALGGLMFVYVGYQYILSVLEAATPDKDLIQRAIFGILIIIFSYAIMRILTRAFLT